MNTIDLLKLHKQTCEKCYGIIQKKNNDYSGGATSKDALANFKMSNSLGLHPVMGLLLRIQDKMMRIRTFISDGALKVSNETIDDAFEDMINYAILGKALIMDERNTQSKTTAPDTQPKKSSLTKDEIVDSFTKSSNSSVPAEIVRAAHDLFKTNYVYFGDIDYFTAALTDIINHSTIEEDEIADSVQMCTIMDTKQGLEWHLVAVDKSTRLYKLLTAFN
jgi:hypothetical protein